MLKVRAEQVKIITRKGYNEVKKLALAVVITEFILAGSFMAIVNYTNLPEMIVIPPVEAKTTQPKAPQAPRKEEVKPQDAEIERIADLIYRLESSSGVNDNKCERIGKHNGYGFAQGVGRNFCLESDDEVRKLVIEWIKDKQNKGFGEKQILCYYNTGKATNNCEYIN